MTGKITDEMVMALADGELHGPEAELVREAIAASSTLQDQFDRYQESRRVLSSGFEGLLDRPVPEDMRKLVLEQTAPGGAVVSLEAARVRRGRLFGFNFLSQAAAAAVLLGAAALGGYQMGQNEPATDGFVLAGLLPQDSPISAALSAAPAGTSIEVGGTEFLAVATYEIAEGQVCREFELSRDGSGAVGLACRVDAGWQVEVAALNVTGSTTGQFLPASADAFELVGTALDAKGAYETVAPDQEACILGSEACADLP
ncbi:hypothetical protein [Hyphomonas sp.]|uniref:anti-sigma factor family protein n=1 Tax=Hyphomonas sp. TaxID=87 RepID=UPI0025BA9F0C|nr:hypothetical protein [Hyphomonas sp.]